MLVGQVEPQRDQLVAAWLLYMIWESRNDTKNRKIDMGTGPQLSNVLAHRMVVIVRVGRAIQALQAQAAEMGDGLVLATYQCDCLV